MPPIVRHSLPAILWAATSLCIATLTLGAETPSTGVSTNDAATEPIRRTTDERRPNVVLIVGDDIGFSDIGCFGAEIDTPNLDRLAANGLRFTQFYNMAKCNPTRSSLFTGLYLPRKGAKHAQSFPQLLRRAGYYTAMCGKEHFDGWVPKRCRASQCFDDSFTYWAINNYFIPPNGKFKNPFTLNGKRLAIDEINAEKEPFYKTDVVTDYALRFLNEAEERNEPFLLYLPYHAAHYPLQARPADIAKYRGKYKQGWDAIRLARFQRQKQLGIIAEDCRLSPPEHNINKYRGPYRGDFYKYRPWDELSREEQDEADLEMAVFAAMIDCMDQNIGRLLARLDEMGATDDTLVMFFSDNGSCPYDSNRDFSIPPGGPESYRCLRAAWANVGNTPYRYYKQYGHEGGCRTHFIAHWPRTIEPGLCDAPAHLVDIFPTLLEMAGTAYPDQAERGPTPPLDGRSLMPLFAGDTRPEPTLVISGLERFRMVRSGDWKIARVNNGPWQLYNVRRDPTELDDLAAEMPERVEQLEQQYRDYRRPTKKD